VVYDRPVSIGDLAGLVIEHVHDREIGRRFVLGIAGPPAAGKSTLAISLRNQINAQSGGRIAEVAPMDGFHLGNATLITSGKLWRKGAPDTFAVAELTALLVKAREQGVEDISWPTYDRVVHEPVPGIGFSATTEILIVEGNYLFLDDDGWSAVGRCLDERWYLDANLETVQQRLLDRHVKGGKAIDVARRKISTSDLPNALLVSKTKLHAHLLLQEVNGHYYIAGASPV
jgi:pantothenate kinase